MFSCLFVCFYAVEGKLKKKLSAISHEENIQERISQEAVVLKAAVVVMALSNQAIL